MTPSTETKAQYQRNFEARQAAHHAATEQRRMAARRIAEAIISLVAKEFPQITHAYLYGSILRGGAFRPDSDIDVAIEGGDMATCMALWRELELQTERVWAFDVRPLEANDLFSERVRLKGELIYERKITTA